MGDEEAKQKTSQSPGERYLEENAQRLARRNRLKEVYRMEYGLDTRDRMYPRANRTQGDVRSGSNVLAWASSRVAEQLSNEQSNISPRVVKLFAGPTSDTTRDRYQKRELLPADIDGVRVVSVPMLDTMELAQVAGFDTTYHWVEKDRYKISMLDSKNPGVVISADITPELHSLPAGWNIMDQPNAALSNMKLEYIGPEVQAESAQSQ